MREAEICELFELSHEHTANDIISSYGDAVVELATKTHELRAVFIDRSSVDKKRRFLSTTR